MAKRIVDEEMKFDIIINGNESQKTLYDLEKRTRSLNEENKALGLQKKQLEKQNKHETDDYKALTASIDANATASKVLLKEKALLEKQGKQESEAYAKLTKDITDNETATRELTAQKNKLERGNQHHTEEYKKLSQSIRENNKEVKDNKAKMAELQQQIGLNGLTMAQLTSKATQLKLTLRNLIPGSADHQRFSKELKEVQGRIDELNGKAKESKMSLGSMADGFNRYSALALGFIGMLAGMAVSIQKVLDVNGKLAASQTNVMKTTGMTKKEVDELTKSFGILKTRTGRIELLGIAEVGGRLGIAKEEILDFVKVMDKSAVALGDSFEGGPEVVADKLGKIKGLYEQIKNVGVEAAFESVGSALNELGASGLASEQNVAEFMTRVGTMPEKLKPSIQQAAGLGAAFEESGLKAEIAGNNYSKVITIAARDYQAFATVMRRPAAEIKNLLNTDPTEFFFQFSNSLKGLDATDLAQVLDYLKLNDNEVKMVLGAASSNVDLFRQKIALASESMAEATSLTDEYNLKNQGLDAIMARLQKKVVGWFTSDTMVKWITALIDGFARLIGAVEDNDGAMSGIRNTLVFTAKVLAILVTGFLSYTAATQLANLWSNTLSKSMALSNIIFKIQYAQLVAQEIATKALALGKALLSRNITNVKAAYQALSVAMGMNPFGAVLAIVGALIVAFKVFGQEADNTADVIRGQVEVQKEMADQTSRTKTKVSDLIAVMKDENATVDQKAEALKRLREIGKGYLDDLTMENILTAEGTRLIDRFIKSIDQMAKAKAMVNVKSKLMEQQMESDNKVLALSLEKKANKNEGMSGMGEDGKLFGLGSRNKMEIQMEMDEEKARTELIKNQVAAMDSTQKQEIDMLRNRIKQRTAQFAGVAKDSKKFKELSMDVKADTDALNVLIGLEDTGPATEGTRKAYVPNSDADKAAAKAKKEADDAHKKRMDDLKKQIEELRELKRKGIDDGLSLMKDGFEKELAIENEQHARKLEDLKRQMISETALAGADAKINDPKSSKRDVDFWTQQKQVWVDKNAHLNTIIRHEESLHYNKIGTIIEKEYAKQIKKLDEQYKREKQKRETNYLGYLNGLTSFEEAKAALQGILSQDELDKIKTIEQAKAALQEDFNKQELARELKHIEESIGKMEQQLTPLTLFGTQINLLTPEQRDKILQDIEFMQNASEKLKAAMAAKGKNGTGEKSEEERDTEMKGVFNNLNGGVDILGFTPEQWEQTYNNLDTLHGRMTAGVMVVQALQNMWGQYDSYMTATENNRLKQYEKGADSRKRKLKWELDNGYISQVQYKKGVEKLEQDVERQKAEIEYKQAKRKKAMSIVETIINTSIAIMQAYSQLGPIGGTIAAVLIGTMGALQLKNIMEQPLPARGYEKGLYPEYVKREQDGKIFKSEYGGKTRSGMVRKPTHFLTGENGPEMIIDSKAYRDLSPETRNALERELKGIKGFENGLYNDNLKRFETPQESAAPVSVAANGGISLEVALAVISRNSDIMEKIYNDGVVAYHSRDPRDIKKVMDDMDRIKNSKNKAQI